MIEKKEKSKFINRNIQKTRPKKKLNKKTLNRINSCKRGLNGQ